MVSLDFLMTLPLQVHQQLFAQVDKCPEIKVGDHWFRRFQDQLYFTTEYEDVSLWQKSFSLDDFTKVGDYSFELPNAIGQISLSLLKGREIDKSKGDQKNLKIKAPEINQKVTIKFKHDNPKCLPDYRQHSRSLKKVLQELSIAPWQRKRLPFLYYVEVLIAVLGHFVCKPFMIDDLMPYLRVRWQGK